MVKLERQRTDHTPRIHNGEIAGSTPVLATKLKNVMTHQELIDNGWVPKDCKIGILYFKDKFFGKLQEELFDLRSIENDMESLGRVSTFKGIKQLQIAYYQRKIKELELAIEIAKENIVFFEENN